MFFRVENLGPLREAEVDLSKEMLLLTGPNSTGKTYLAWSVYGLYRFKPTRAPKVFRLLVDEILASSNQAIGFERIVARWPSLLKGIAEQLASRLHLCFAAERHHFADVKVTLRRGSGEPSKLRSGNLVSSVGEFRVRISTGAQVGIQFFHRIERDGSTSAKRAHFEPILFAEIPRRARDALVKSLEAPVAKAVMWTCWPDCTLLPTERTAVDMFAKELSIRRTELVARTGEAQLEFPIGVEIPPDDLVVATRDVGRYPWPIQDSLDLANDLDFYAKEESEFADLAAELEALLGGALDLSKEGAIGFKPVGKSQAIGIHLTSSVVKSLASLVFYLRHRAEKGDLLMIDEPELNLHPDNQRKVARLLAKVVNRGLRLIMSTHSDYLLRELNNLILLSRNSKPIRKLREKHGYADSELLAPAKIGVYLFKDGTAESVPVTEEGFEVKTIEDEINRMNAMSQEIYAALL